MKTKTAPAEPTWIIRPTGDRVLIERIAADSVSKGGVIIPDVSREKRMEGIVRAVGLGKLLDDGRRSEIEFGVGDRVVFSRYGGAEVDVSGQKLLLIPAADVLAVMEPVE